MIDLEHRTALVIGASRGLGAEIARELGRSGAAVALVARRADALADVAAEVSAFGVQTLAIPADVTSAADRDGVVEQVERYLGPVEILVNNAGIGKTTPFVDEDPERVMATNVVAPIAVTRLVVPGMVDRKRGAVLNVASLAGKAALPYLVDYSASKAALMAFSFALREELRGTGVTVTAAAPGFFVDTGMDSEGGKPAPWYLRSSSAERVAREAVTAMAFGRSEAIVNRVPQRQLFALGALSEPLFRTTSRALGLTRFLRDVSDRSLP